MSFAEKSSFGAIQVVSGLIIILIGLFALTGWLLHIPVLSSIRSDFIPMAPATAIVFTLYGLFFMNSTYLLSKGYEKQLVILVSILSLYCSLQFIEYFLNVDLTFDTILFPSTTRLKNFAVNQMSPYTGLLFFLSGVTVLLKLKSRNSDSVLKIVSAIGLFITFAAFVACLGYLLGTPFLYSGHITPLAAPTAIAFLSLGCALIALSGEKAFPMCYFTGQTANARILRSILPIVVFGLLVEGFLNVIFTRHSGINSALLVALLTLFMVVVTIIIVIRISQNVFKRANEVEIERKLAVKELLKFKLGIERSNEVIFMTDIDGNILYVNPSFEKTYGYTKEEVLGKNPRILKSGTLDNSFYREFWEHLLKKELVVKEIENKTKEGSVVNIETSVNPILGESNEIFGFLAIQHDITQRKKADLQLLDYSEKLKISNDTKDRLFNIIAHDLRSPFNSILGFSEILINEYDQYSDEQHKAFIKKIKDSSETAFLLLENLLYWSRTQTGGIIAKPISLNLFEIVSYQIDILNNIAGSKKIDIRNLVTPVTVVYADKDMVKIILLNLINNAIKFTPKDGVITISAHDFEKEIEISIADNGLGISHENLNNLFKINFSQSTMGTSGEKGTGLGLIICKEFVEINGGNIRAESTLGKGSNFCFTLPKTAPLSEG